MKIYAGCPNCGYHHEVKTIGHAKQDADAHNKVCVKQRDHVAQFEGRDKKQDFGR